MRSLLSGRGGARRLEVGRRPRGRHVIHELGEAKTARLNENNAKQAPDVRGWFAVAW